MSEWKKYRLEEIAQINKKTIGKSFPYNNIEYIDTSSVTENRFEKPQLLPISEAPSRAKRLIEKDDTIISTVRPIQKHYGYIKSVKPNTVVSTGFAVVSPEKVDSKFLYYYLIQDEITNYLNTIAEGGTTTFPSFRPEELKNLILFAPGSIQEQSAIAEILSSLDDKIELNNEINKNLEALAQALFKHWFVDFEFPDENGQPYKSSGGEMLESELGLIPRNWKVSDLSEISKVIDCLHSAKPKQVNENTGYLLLQLNNILDNGLLSIFNKYNISKVDYLKWISRIEVAEGDIVITNVGRSGAVARIPSNLKAALGRNMTGIRLLETFPFFGFMATLMKSGWMKKEIESKLDSGTILDSLNVRSIPRLRFIKASHELLMEAEGILIAVWKKMEYNLSENQNIASLRNTLLPKLISGELEVKEALKQTEKVL